MRELNGTDARAGPYTAPSHCDADGSELCGDLDNDSPKLSFLRTTVMLLFFSMSSFFFFISEWIFFFFL